MARLSWMLAAAAVATSTAALAQGVGYLDYSAILKEAPQAKASHHMLESEYEPLLSKVKQDRQDVQRLRAKVRSLGPETNPLERANDVESLKSAQNQLRSDEQSYNTTLALRRRQLLSSFRDLVKKETKEYAHAHGLGVVLVTGAVYAGPGVNITNAILARLESDYAAAQESHKKQP